MYDFGKKRNNRILVYIVVGVLVVAMVLPMAYELLAAIF